MCDDYTSKLTAELAGTNDEEKSQMRGLLQAVCQLQSANLAACLMGTTLGEIEKYYKR